jgi:hypothetical protein
VLAGLCVGVLASMLVSRSAPATVAEQRARLPPPATCDDPVVGKWRAHKFTDPIWEIFTLDIRRVPGKPDKLEGVITNHYWHGDETREQPGPCDAVQFHRVIIKMPAEGKAKGNEVSFRGTSWKREHLFCGSPFGYNLDHFTGTIDPKRQEFQSVNNDGGRYVNHPTVFRRIKCGEEALQDEPEERSIDIERPPLFPDRSTCNCSIGACPGP